MSTTRTSAAVKPFVLTANQQHVANRFTFGVDEAVVAQVRAAGSARGWLERQMAVPPRSDTAAASVKGWFPLLADSPSAAWARVKDGQKSAWDFGYDLVSYTMARKIVARHQVQEVMADFWSNLLYIPAGEDRSFPWRVSYDEVIRKHALGTYRDLLRAAVVHPAMSGWLNNSSNTKNGINENLGRELLELFTVGRSAGYSEAEVKDSARILTGFKVRIFDGYDASYEPQDHHVGRVSVLGFSHANASPDGRPVVDAYLEHLARHPSTATRIAKRLCTRFVSDDPSAAIIGEVAKAYRTSGTDIRATLRAMTRHPEFVSAHGRKVRTPIEDVVNAARVLSMVPTKASTDAAMARHVVWMSNAMGQKQFDWPRPDGFPETSAIWTSGARVIRSWNTHYALAGNWWGSKDVALPARAAALPTTWPLTLGELVEHQSRILVGRPSTAVLRKAVADLLTIGETHSFASAAAVSDWTWTVTRATVLNLPEGMLR